MNEEELFDGVSLFILGKTVAHGSVHLRKLALTSGCVFLDENCDTPDPFTHPYTLSPISEPYIAEKGHHIFDLSYFCELTLIDSPPRLCFHDPAQEAGITLNFDSKMQFDSFFSCLKKSYYITAPSLPGFFQIARLYPSLSPSQHFDLYKKDMKSKILQSAPDDQSILELDERHNQILSQVLRNETPKTLIEDDVRKEMDSNENISSYLKQYKVSPNFRSEMWIKLNHLGDDNSIYPFFAEKYLLIKKQWDHIYASQFHRASSMNNMLESIYKKIIAFKQKILSVIPNLSMIKVTFNVIVTIVHLYQFLSNNINDVLYMIRVFYRMLILKVEKSNGVISFTITDKIKLGQTDFEALIFWSLIVLLEKGEIVKQFEKTKLNLCYGIELMSDLIFAIHPKLYQVIYSNNPNALEYFLPFLTAYLSNVLPVCDCCDLWLASLAAPNMLEFIENILITILLTKFRSAYQEHHLQLEMKHLIDEHILLLDIANIQFSSFVLTEKSRELMRENEPQL